MVLLQTLIRYALVGGGAAAIHLLLLLLLPRVGAPLPLANVAGYLTALLWGYVLHACLLYTSPSPRDMRRSRMPSSA